MNKPQTLITVATCLALLLNVSNLQAQNKGATEAKKNLERLEPFLTGEPEVKAAIEKVVPETPTVPFKENRKVLVLTRGTYGPVHAHGAAGLLLLLRAADAKYDGLEITEVFTDFGLTSEVLAEYDAVVLNNVGRVDNKENEAFYTQTLPDYVRAGGGLWANHSAAHLFMDAPDNAFNRMICGFSGKGHVHPKRHGQAYPIQLPEPDHPLARPFLGESQDYALTFIWYDGDKKKTYPIRFSAPKMLADELNIVHKDSNRDQAARVVLRVADEAADRYPEDVPAFSRSLIWVRPLGEGRVYYTQFGHNFEIFSVAPMAQSMLDGLQYATGDYAVPDAPTVASGQ